MIKKNPFLIFAVKLLGAYAIWKGIYYLLETYEVSQWVMVKETMARWTNYIAACMCTYLMRMDVVYNDRNIIPKGAPGVYLADHCLAIPAMVVFAIFIILYQGDWRNKLWFIPFGLVNIVLINSLRIAGLAYLQQGYLKMFFAFCHSYVYLIMAYGLIFLLIVWWVEVFAEPKQSHAHS